MKHRGLKKQRHEKGTNKLGDNFKQPRTHVFELPKEEEH